MSRIAFVAVRRVFRVGGDELLAIDNVSFEVQDKEFVAIVGPSGCGKTTLLRMAAGLDFPSSGSVWVGDMQVRGPGPDRAVVFQQFALLPWKTARENIEFGLKCQGQPIAKRREAVAHYVTLMGLQGHEDAYPHQLSGGMQQRVAIARSYVLEPEVLLMDEPFGALDAQTRMVMQEELIRLARVNPRTVLFITHSVEEAVYLADRIVVMTQRPGRMMEIVEVSGVRKREGWDRLDRVEEATDQESFVRLRARIQRSLREQQEGRVPREAGRASEETEHERRHVGNGQ